MRSASEPLTATTSYNETTSLETRRLDGWQTRAIMKKALVMPAMSVIASFAYSETAASFHSMELPMKSSIAADCLRNSGARPFRRSFITKQKFEEKNESQ